MGEYCDARAVLVEVTKEAAGGAYSFAGGAGYTDGGSLASGAPSDCAEDLPTRVRADDSGVVRREGRDEFVGPCLKPLGVFVAEGQYARVDQERPEVMSGLPRWGSIEAGVRDRSLSTDVLQKGSRHGLEEPPDSRIWTTPLSECVGQVCERVWDGACCGREQLPDDYGHGAANARLLEVLIAGRTAESTHVVPCCSGARPADPHARFGRSDEGLDLTAAGTRVRGAERAPVASGADRADRPRRDVSGLSELANDALRLGGLVAGSAQIRRAILAACGNGAFLAAATTRADRRLVTALAIVVSVDDGGDMVQATAACAGSLRSSAVPAQRLSIVRSGGGRS